jgi:hypothetical protein
LRFWLINLFLDPVEDEIEQLIVTLQDPGHFSTASEFDPYSLIDILGQVEDGLPLAFIDIR